MSDGGLRFLFTFAGGTGHVLPLVPIARAVAAAGRTVAFASPPDAIPRVEAAGFRALPVGSGGKGPPRRAPLLRVDAAREERDVRERFIRGAARTRVPLMIDICERWQPDALVCDEMDFASHIAAELLGLPQATVVVLLAGGFNRPDVVADALDEVRAEHGLAPDPEREMGQRLVLTFAPPSFRDPAFALPPTGHAIRPPLPSAHLGAQPPWPVARPEAPIVYVTLGTVFNLESGDLLPRILEGLRELPVNLLVTSGPHLDPEELGPQPAHVHVAGYLPQESVLPFCHLVVSNAGSGSVLGALTHGLPMVLLPMGADQPHNARRAEALGAARVLDAVDATPAMVRDAASEILGDPDHLAAADALRAEIEDLPDIGFAVALLERFATSRGA